MDGVFEGPMVRSESTSDQAIAGGRVVGRQWGYCRRNGGREFNNLRTKREGNRNATSQQQQERPAVRIYSACTRSTSSHEIGLLTQQAFQQSNRASIQ